MVVTIESTLSLPADPKSVSAARRFVRETLGRSGALAFEEGATLLVSELVTNAVLHARTSPEITLRLNDGRLWVGVHDGSPVIPAPKRYGPNAATGRGLQLVEQVAASWGVQEDESGKVVWFELDRESIQRYADAQQVALMADLAALESEFARSDHTTVVEHDDDGAAPDPSTTSDSDVGCPSLHIPVRA